MGVFRGWGDTWGDVWCDKEKRNVLLGVTFGVTVLTLKIDDCPPFISLFCAIGFENGRLEGGDNPTFLACSKPLRNVWNALFIGVLATLLPYYTYVCACATRFAVWSVCVMRVT